MEQFTKFVLPCLPTILSGSIRVVIEVPISNVVGGSLLHVSPGAGGVVSDRGTTSLKERHQRGPVLLLPGSRVCLSLSWHPGNMIRRDLSARLMVLTGGEL